MLGKIYIIKSKNAPYFYIGSTTKSLVRRLWQHKKKSRFNRLTSSQVIRAGDYFIELLEEVNCSTKEELEAIEYQVMDELSADGSLFNHCVNRRLQSKASKHTSFVPMENEP
jgi:predicted GIY-YIG superfamily endonuclease